jgi:hypothetical protein
MTVAFRAPPPVRFENWLVPDARAWFWPLLSPFRRKNEALQRDRLVPKESGIDCGRHLRYIKSSAQKLVHSLSSDEGIGNHFALFYYQQLRVRAPCQHRFHAVERAGVLVFQHLPTLQRRTLHLITAY